MQRVIKFLFTLLVIKPVVLVCLGLNIVGREKLKVKGPLVIVANHNSHLDAVVLMSLFPLKYINKIRPVAAADYFFKNKFLTWLAIYCIGIIPIDRYCGSNHEEVFNECHKALDNQEILIIFPEGRRGVPEQMSTIKKGVYHLVKQREDTTVLPIVMHGLGKALPRGEALLVPFNCDVVIGEPLEKPSSSEHFVELLKSKFNELFKLCITKELDSSV